MAKASSFSVQWEAEKLILGKDFSTLLLVLSEFVFPLLWLLLVATRKTIKKTQIDHHGVKENAGLKLGLGPRPLKEEQKTQ